jgi:hypothetical protein
MPNALVNSSDCASHCTFDDASTKLDLHTRYSRSLLPTVQLSGTDQPSIVFAPEQQFGGSFGLQLKVSDRCGVQYQNVTVNVVCVDPPTISAAVMDSNPGLQRARGSSPSLCHCLVLNSVSCLFW